MRERRAKPARVVAIGDGARRVTNRAGPRHPLLGQAWLRPGYPNETCSKCGATIPCEEVPLVLFRDRTASNPDPLMYVYCGKCDAAIFSALMAAQTPVRAASLADTGGGIPPASSSTGPNKTNKNGHN